VPTAQASRVAWTIVALAAAVGAAALHSPSGVPLTPAAAAAQQQGPLPVPPALVIAAAPADHTQEG
jgi:hypothetical protein